jgi:hypothetical protein
MVHELQVEFTDHMVTSMEIWEKESELTFLQVKRCAESKFVGHSSFKSIQEERKHICKRVQERENDN